MSELHVIPETWDLTVPQYSAVGTILLSGAVVLLAGSLNAADRPSNAAVWGGLALAAYAGGLLCLVGVLQGDGLGLSHWRFAPWTLLWYSVAFGLATTTWIQPQPGQIAISSVLRALLLIAVGMSSWVVGYAIGPGRLARKLAVSGLNALGRRFASEVRSSKAPWILYLIGVTARIVSAVTAGRLGYVGDAASAVSTATGYGQILASLSLCAPLAVAAAAIQAFSEQVRGARVTLVLLFAAEVGFGLASGIKGSIITVVLAVVMPYCAARHRLPKGSIVLVALLFLLIVVPFTLAYRTAARSGTASLTSSEAVNMAPSLLGQSLPTHDPTADMSASLQYLEERAREIDASAIIVQRTPEQIRFVSPFQLIEGPAAAMVPRAIWPNKPIFATGYQISVAYYGYSSTVYTSSGISQAADLYRYGGWLSVIAGMLLLGCGVRLLDDVLDIWVNPHVIFLVLLLLPGLVKNEVGWSAILSGLPSTAAVWIAAVAITFRPRR